MRKLVKMPRKLKALALGAGVASLFLGAPSVWAAEYQYDGLPPGGRPGHIDLASIDTSNPEHWFASFFNNGDKGIWVPTHLASFTDNRFSIDYGSNEKPLFVFGGVASLNSSSAVTGNEIHYNGGANSTNLLVGGLSHSGDAESNKVTYNGGGLGENTYNGFDISIIGGLVGGDGVNNGSARFNEVRVAAGGTIKGSIVGGVILSASSTGHALGNKVNIGVNGTDNLTIGENTGSAGAHVAGGLNLGAGDAAENSVTLTHSGTGNLLVYGDILGGDAAAGRAQGNTVSLTKAKVYKLSGNHGNVIGNRSDTGSALGWANKAKPDVSVKGSDIKGNVIGGVVSTGTVKSVVSGHNVKVEDTYVDSSIFGGLAQNLGAVSNNYVEVLGTSTADLVVGGWVGGFMSGAGDAANNTVFFAGVRANALVGGYTFDGDAANNTVEYGGGELVGHALGAAIAGGAVATGDGDAEKNIVLISGSGNIKGNIFGGAIINGSGTAAGNTVLIALTGTDTLTIGTNVQEAHIVGGSAYESSGGNATENAVIINAAAGTTLTIYGEVIGGDSDKDTAGAATGNAVSIIEAEGANVEVHGDVYGNRSGTGSTRGLAGGSEYDVYIAGATIDGTVYGGFVDDGTASTEVKDHNVYITGANIAGEVIGGKANGAGKASGNYVTIMDSRSDKVFGGWVDSGSGAASDNRVTLTNAIVEDVYGGRVFGDGSNASAASNNQITIEGGTVNGETIVGGSVDTLHADNKIENNTVTLKGDIELTHSGVYLYGAGWGANTANATGNTLNLIKFMKTGSGAIREVSGFQTYNFEIDHSNIGNFALTANTVNMTGAQVGFVKIYGGSKLTDGNTIGLISATTLTGYDTTQEIIGVHDLWEYDLAIAKNGNDIRATVLGGGKSSPETKALAEGWLSGPAFLNQGADLLEKEGIKEAGIQAWREQGPAVFAALGYSDTRHKTGSHVDVKGPSLVVGLARAKETANGARLTYGGFLEAGWGSYDSYNSFSGRDEVRGDGDTNYYGIGFLARRENAKRGDGRLYTEGSLRVGQVKTDFTQHSGNLAGSTYDAKSVYYGLHLGVGYIKELKGDAALDLYTKILYTRAGSDSVSVLGHPVELDAVTSLRWRAGLRYTKAVGEKNEFYAGLAYDHEFDGKAKGTAEGSPIESPKMKGGTGIGELGVTFKGKNSLVDLKVEGYTGKREGVGFAAQFKWFF